jgi:dTDP-4-dehydrorhamnose reductase
MKILGTGLTGLVGTRVMELLAPQCTGTNLSLETGFDITNHTSVLHEIEKSPESEWFFHFAAMTDVDGAEKDRINGKNGKTWAVNVDATENIATVCKKSNKHVLYISTDYVFDGQKDFYSEDDIPNPQGWYGITKYEGEKHIQSLGELGLVIRIANPYRSIWTGKPDFVHKILERFKNNLPVSAPTDQLFVPTFIDDIAVAIRYLVEHNASGIYHVMGTGAISPFQGAQMIAESYGYDKAIVGKTTFKEFFQNRAPRPFHAYLKNDKISQCGIRMTSFTEGIHHIAREEKGL